MRCIKSTMWVALLWDCAFCVNALKMSVQHAPRICRPAPPEDRTPINGKRCLIIGDSVSIGYTAQVSMILNKTCSVAHAPFSGDGGACDTRYGLLCGDMWLGTELAGGRAPNYDAVVFNFGLHDTNDEAADEEARDEHVPLDVYGDNLVEFVTLIRKLQPAARVAWMWTTPMHFDMHLNSNVQKYNAVAAEQLCKDSLSQRKVDGSLNLYSVITDRCGEPPYYGSVAAPNATRHCPLINDNEEYHYNAEGYETLAENVAEEFKKLLSMESRPIERADNIEKSRGVLCPDRRTGCPSDATCMAVPYSNSEWGCCRLPSASSCGDGWHCCPQGTTCIGNGTNPISPQHPYRANYSHVCVP